ncbi:hypothetical protein [Aquipseudomonas alcaligenes]|uniref:hypothetical protein n=1 Tax=Aquipseudomonas alcaligenes TaxID=43263 RepID=UPI000970EEE1|nr:hypothetical protein [Pseudomonas alcaligenes]
MATAKSTETPVPAGFASSADKAKKLLDNEKKSCSISVQEAVLLLGKTVLVELAWDDDPEPLWCLVHIAGVVLGLQGVYEHPHFMVFNASGGQAYPNEMFWSDIRTLRVMDQSRH